MLTTSSQVLISFAASAFITLALCTAYYLIDSESAMNPVDHLCNQSLTSSSARQTGNRFTKWAPILQTAMLNFSDIQLVSSISLLASGYSQLRCGLDVFHWQIIVDLSWFSSITHLTTLTCLRRYFQERPALRLWRLFSMTVVAAMLSCAMISTGWVGSNDLPASLPAQCLYHPSAIIEVTSGEISWNNLEYDKVYVALSMGLLGTSYVSRMIQMFPRISILLWRTFRIRPSKALQNYLRSLRRRRGNRNNQTSRMFLGAWYIFVMSIYCILEAAGDFYSSVLWEVLYFARCINFCPLTGVTDNMAMHCVELGGHPGLDGPHFKIPLWIFRRRSPRGHLGIWPGPHNDVDLSSFSIHNGNYSR